MMNIYDCFSPTILIIYRYFQFSSSGSTTERRASPGVLKGMHNNVASGLLGWPGLGRVSQHWDAELRRSAAAPGGAVPRAASLAPGALCRPCTTALAAPAFEAAACCSCLPPAGAAALGRGDGAVTRAPPGPAPSEEGLGGRGSYSLSKGCYSL